MAGFLTERAFPGFLGGSETPRGVLAARGSSSVSYRFDYEALPFFHTELSSLGHRSCVRQTRLWLLALEFVHRTVCCWKHCDATAVTFPSDFCLVRRVQDTLLKILLKPLQVCLSRLFLFHLQHRETDYHRLWASLFLRLPFSRLYVSLMCAGGWGSASPRKPLPVQNPSSLWRRRERWGWGPPDLRQRAFNPQVTLLKSAGAAGVCPGPLPRRAAGQRPELSLVGKWPLSAFTVQFLHAFSAAPSLK